MLFDEVYPRIIDKLRKENKISLPFKTPNVQKKRDATNVGKCQNTTDQSKRMSAKRMTLVTNDSMSRQDDQECQSSNLYVVTDDSTESAVYLLPTSTKILNKTNLVSNIVETVYYL